MLLWNGNDGWKECELNNIKYHIFGHIHDGFGVSKHRGIDTIFVNASTLNSRYYPTNKPVMIYVKGKGKHKKDLQEQKDDENQDENVPNNLENEHND